MKAQVVARLTAFFSNGQRWIVEVHANATVGSFYCYYKQTGGKRSTKQLAFVRDRFDGITPHHRRVFETPGLNWVEAGLWRQAKAVPHLFPLIEVKVRIIRKRKYRELLNMPNTFARSIAPTYPDPRLQPKPVLRYPVRIPSNHTTIKKRVSILLGRG